MNVPLHEQAPEISIGLISNHQGIALGLALLEDAENQYIQFDKNALGKVQVAPKILDEVDSMYPMPMITTENYSAGHSQQGMWIEFTPASGQS